MNSGRLHAVVVNYNAGPWLARCIDALLKSSANLHVVVVDNGSTDQSLAAIADQPIELLKNSTNRGFGAACNQGALGLGTDDSVVFVNPDCVVEVDCLAIMERELSTAPDIGIVGAWVMNPDGSVQGATLRRLPTVRRTLRSLFKRSSDTLSDTRRNSGDSAQVEAVSGALMMVSARCLHAIGGFDEAYFLHCEDLDLMRRAGQAGWQTRLCYTARADHAKGISHASAPLRAQAHKHRSLIRYFSASLGPVGAVGWSALIWAHFLLRAPIWWLAGRRR
ncbi:MAG: glycosyltransferase family 2 protein [Lysobacterales bacterium]